MFLQRIVNSHSFQIIQEDSPDDFIELYKVLYLESRGNGSVIQNALLM